MNPTWSTTSARRTALRSAATAMPRNTWGVASLLGGILVGVPTAHAEPQISTSMTLGGGVRQGEPHVSADGSVANGSTRGVFHMGLWGDCLFFRSRAKDMAFGPHLQVATTSFSSVDLGGGATWLIPVGGPALTFNVSGYARGGEHGWAPGVSAALFLGSKSYNFHGNYALTLGGVLEAKYGLTRDPFSKHAEITVAAQIDLEALALPFIFAWEAIRGPRNR